ncbi:MAG TPA: fatty acid oxidation complex subunit alpha FadJ [Gemmatimonadaceae bacterium]|nr:fatty acid oxidation complex subunit alpha FadJ [Gemmatimonadaceae bacterium]
MSADAQGPALRVDVEDGVAVITFDLPGESVNKFSAGVVEEFAAVIDRLQRDADIRAAVLISGKPDGFIAGADIEEFLTIKTAADGEAMSAAGQMMMDRIAKLRTPLVAAIHGACMGGGLEASLACAYRICTDHPKTVLALPEVMLGIIPGAGGTQRLPRTVGLRNALDMILTGKNIRAKKALQMGLVDEMVHPAILRQIAVDRARKLGAGALRRSRGAKKGGLANLLLERNPLGRALVFRQAHASVMEKTHGNYPAPLAALDAVRAGVSHGTLRGFQEEARRFGEMAVTPQSRELTFLFFATTALKKDPGTDVPAEALPVRTLGVLGAGFMGAGVASVAAMQRTVVRMKDAAHDRVAAGLRAVSGVLRERLVRKQITKREFADQMSLVGGTTDYAGFQHADLVIEAVFEDLALKHKVLKETEAVVPGDAIYASNTSTIPITRIAEASQRAEQVLGMHFFSPVHKMPLLEVIVTRRTSPVATATAVAYGKKLGKHVIVVNDGPGFYTTRTLSAYMNEAGYLLDEGVAIDALDHAMVDMGFPVGPITLMDEVGLDVGGKVGHVIYDAFGERLKPSASLAKVVADGRTGRKGGRGFYRYEGGKKRGVDESVYALLPTGATRKEMPAAEMQQRCMLALLNEAALCLEEGILRSPRDGDVGAVFGIGFPPFLGGPFRHIDAEGAASIVRQLETLHQRFAPRFAPCKLLVGMAQTKARFYPESGNPLG